VIETDTIELPTFLASALLYGDTSGIEDNAADMAMLEFVEEWLVKEGWHVTDVSEDSEFGRFPAWLSRLSGDVSTYTIYRTVK
jgi:hypothetical protein